MYNKDLYLSTIWAAVGEKYRSLCHIFLNVSTTDRGLCTVPGKLAADYGPWLYVPYAFRVGGYGKSAPKRASAF